MVAACSTICHQSSCLTSFICSTSSRLTGSQIPNECQCHLYLLIFTCFQLAFSRLLQLALRFAWSMATATPSWRSSPKRIQNWEPALLHNSDNLQQYRQYLTWGDTLVDDDNLCLLTGMFAPRMEHLFAPSQPHSTA